MKLNRQEFEIARARACMGQKEFEKAGIPKGTLCRVMSGRSLKQAKINAKRREWRADNKDRVQQYNRQYWERVAGKSLRLSYAEYGIDRERLNELMRIVRSGKYDAVVLSAARRANESVAEHIVLSIKENASYETLEAKQASGKIERIALGRTDFYEARRLFFHYLDIELKNIQAEV